MGKALSRTADRVLWMDEKVKITTSSRKKPNFLLFLLLLFSVMISSLFFVWSRIQVIQVGYEISSALKEGRALDEVNKKLRVEIATLKSYTRIEKIAIEELKMSKPKPDQVIIIK